MWVEVAGKMQCHRVEALSEYHLTHLIQLVANENHQILNVSSPILSASLLDGSRIQCVMSPVTPHAVIAIRRVVARSMLINDFCMKESANQSGEYDLECITSVEDKYLLAMNQQDWCEALHQALVLKKTIVIAGGTSSGKTTLLNACLREISHSERVISLEDTREVILPHANQVNLVAAKSRNKHQSISMQELVQCSLRLRPDRIIVGEIRGPEILDFLSAAATGHEGSITTIHAGSPQLALLRMKQLYKLNHVPSMTDQDIIDEIRSVVDIIVQVKRLSSGRTITEVVDL